MAPRALLVCFAVIRSVPVVFITAVIVWSYYAFVVQMCLFTVSSVVEKVVYLILYHPLMLMMCWCYWKTIFTPVATTPKQFYLSEHDRERLDRELSQTNRRQMLVQLAKNLPMQCRTLTGEMRYCEKCKALKPDRAHHCSVCGRCVLKMDHHCPWVNNCVNFNNYKYFILFLGYALLYCVYVALTSLQYFISFWTGITEGLSPITNLHIVFLFFASVMFAISLVSLFGYHCYLVSKNRSTLEVFQTPIFASGPDKEGFNLGCRRNLVQVFGTDRRQWFLPVFTSHGDGLTYPVRTVDEDYDSLLGQRQRWAEEGEADTDDNLPGGNYGNSGNTKLTLDS